MDTVYICKENIHDGHSRRFHLGMVGPHLQTDDFMCISLTQTTLCCCYSEPAGASGKSKKGSGEQSNWSGASSSERHQRAASIRSQPLNLSQVAFDELLEV